MAAEYEANAPVSKKARVDDAVACVIEAAAPQEDAEMAAVAHPIQAAGPQEDDETENPEINELLYGEGFSTVGKFVVYERPVATLQQQRSSKTVEDIVGVLDELSEEEWRTARQTQNLVMLYEGDFELSGAYKSIADKWIGYPVVFCIGLVSASGLAVYLNKKGHRYLPTAMGVDDLSGTTKVPRFYRFKNFRAGVIEQSLVTVLAAMTQTMSGMKITTPRVGNYSFDQILDITKKMDRAHLLLIKGRILAKNWPDRSEIEKIFMKVYRTIMEIRAVNAQVGVCWNAYNPPMPIIPLDQMINLKLQKGTRMEEETMKTKTCNLTDLFTKKLFDKSGIVILGSHATTGFGKSQFALRLAVEYAKAYNKVKGLPKEDAVVVCTNTIDGAKDVKFKPGYVWVVDDMSPSDQTQAMHMSENMMKVLLAPATSGTIRCRNVDLHLPVGVPRIFTANAENAEQWVMGRFKWSAPCQRKSIVFEIKQPLIPDSWRKAQEADDGDDVEVTAALRDGVGNIFDETPAEMSLLGSLLKGVRGMFGSRA